MHSTKRRPEDWLIIALLTGFFALALWSAKVQLDYLPKTSPAYCTP